MQPQFTEAEVIQLAISMEEEGVKFYEKYATMVDVELKKVLLGMAEDEKEHAKVFKKMYKEIQMNPGEEDYLFSEHVQDFFASHAKSEGFNRSQGPIDSVRDALKMAAETERITIGYYKSLLAYAKDNVKAVLERLIQEEEKHLERLEELI